MKRIVILAVLLIIAKVVYASYAPMDIIPIPTFNNAPTVSLNTSNQLSTTKNVRMSYAITATTAVSLLNLNGTAMAYLEISQNNSTWVEINRAGVTRALSVAISVGLNETQSYNLQGECPKGWYRRIRTSTTGTGSAVAFVSGQETSY